MGRDGMQGVDLQGLLMRTVRLFDAQMQRIEAGEDATASPEWAQCFGKESVVSALARLVAMHKQLREQQAWDQAQDPQEMMPAGDADWEALELCVRRWRELKAD